MPNLAQVDPAKAYREGRRAGLATAALALSVTAFVNLLGFEKSLLAVALALMALRGSTSPTVVRRSWTALALALIYLATIVLVLILFQHRLQLLLHALRQLQQLG